MKGMEPAEVTRLLEQHRGGDGSALEQLLSVLYDELRALAVRQMGRERRDHTLQPTALVHEAYMKLVSQNKQDWENRQHFLALAATSMRRILVNHAQEHRALKRGGAAERVTLFEAASAFEERAEDIVAMDEALTKLAALDELDARVVELRFFAGLSVDEAARVLEMSSRTVERRWRAAKAWLRKEISGGA